METTELDNKIYLYAQFIITKALNLKPRQKLHLLRVPIDAAEFIEILKQVAYKHGINVASINWENDESRLLAIEKGKTVNLEIDDQIINKSLKYAMQGDAFIIFDCTCSGLFDGMKDDSALQYIINEGTQLAPLWKILSRNLTKWTMITVPTTIWARKRFPNKKITEGKLLLWEDIFNSCKITLSDPDFSRWETHILQREKVVSFMNKKQFVSLHFRNTGTDIMVNLADTYRWMGPRFITPEGLAFIPNLPMNEIFTTPHRLGVNGKVTATRPVVVNGLIIDGMQLDFHKGRVIKTYAEKGENLLNAIMKTDEGVNHLGEVALVPYFHGEQYFTTNIYYSTLFDENAGSHLALGRAYRISLQNDLEDTEFIKAGGNVSDLHIDFTIGSETLSVDGIFSNGKRLALIRDNTWMIDI